MVVRNYAVMVVDAAAIPVALVLVWSFLSHQLPNAHLVSRVGLSAGYAVFVFAVLVGVSAYLRFLCDLLRGVIRLAAPLLVGMAFMQLILLQDIRVLAEPGAARQSAAALLLWFWVRGCRVADVLSSLFPIPDHELRKLVTRFPPKSLHDMWPFHMFMVFLLLVMPFIVGLLWGD